MKKLFLCLAAVVMLSSCSSDDAGSTTNVGFESSILINGVGFIPGTPNPDLVPPANTAFDTNVNNGLSNFRIFQLVSTPSLGDLQGTKALQVSIMYPITQASVNGTYDFALSEPELAGPYVQGTYVQGMSMDLFKQGTLTVTDLGNNKFKLVFNNVVTNETQTTIAGSFEGTFVVDVETDF